MPTNKEMPPAPSNEDRESPVPMMTSKPSTHSTSAQMELAFEQRNSAVFHQWLRSMATDAEAALAAAMSYRELSPVGRDHWLESLQKDLSTLDIPRIAVYAPLLAVEQDPERRRLLEQLADNEEDHTEIVASRLALMASKPGGERVYVVVCPLYLQFVQVLACGVKGGRFCWVRHDPIVSKIEAPVAGDRLKGVVLEQASFNECLDELAATILSHQRQGLELPEAVFVLSDLLGGIGP